MDLPKRRDAAYPASHEGLIVRGVVHFSAGGPLVGGVVYAYDKDLRGKELLGNGTTAADGRYEIRYEAEKFSRGEAGSADLFFEVANQGGALLKLVDIRARGSDETRLKVSHIAVDETDGSREIAIIFNAPPVAIVDLVVEGRQSEEESEYERLVTALQPVLLEAEPASLTESEIAFLAAETEIDVRLISTLARAEMLGKQIELPGAIFYGFAREGLPPELHSLALQSQATLRRALEQAVADRIIPAKYGEAFEGIIGRLHSLLVRKGLAEPVAPGVPALGAILATTLPQPHLQERFLFLFVQHEGSTPEFWKKLRESQEFGAEVVSKVQRSLQFALLTRGNIPLISRLQVLAVRDEHASVRDLARYDESDWLRLIEESEREGADGIPRDVPGADAAERKKRYAAELSARVDATFPTPAVARQVSKQNRSEHKHVTAFFVSNPEFNFETDHIDLYLKSKGEDSLAGIAPGDRPAAVAQLKTWQRVFTVTPKYAEMTTLLEGAVTSARKIARMGKSEFLVRFGQPLGAERAEALYARAERTAVIAANVYARFSPAMNSLDTNVTRRKP